MEQGRDEQHPGSTRNFLKRRLSNRLNHFNQPVFRRRVHLGSTEPDNTTSSNATASQTLPETMPMQQIEPDLAMAYVADGSSATVPDQGPDTNTTVRTFWEQACDEVEKLKEYKGFVAKYQKILLKQDPNEDVVPLAARKDGMRKLIEQ